VLAVLPGRADRPGSAEHRGTAPEDQVRSLQTMVKQAFTSLPGLPGRADPEVSALMAEVGQLSRAGVDEIARSLLRCALAWKRTGDLEFLTCLADDAILTMRLRGYAGCRDALNAAPAGPAGPAKSVDVRHMLTRMGLVTDLGQLPADGPEKS
jgi:hypothetical protein